MVSKDGPDAAAGTWLLGLGTFWGTGALVLAGIRELLAVLGHRSSSSFWFRPEDSPPQVIMPLQKASLAGRKSCACWLKASPTWPNSPSTQRTAVAAWAPCCSESLAAAPGVGQTLRCERDGAGGTLSWSPLRSGTLLPGAALLFMEEEALSSSLHVPERLGSGMLLTPSGSVHPAEAHWLLR